MQTDFVLAGDGIWGLIDAVHLYRHQEDSHLSRIRKAVCNMIRRVTECVILISYRAANMADESLFKHLYAYLNYEKCSSGTVFLKSS